MANDGSQQGNTWPLPKFYFKVNLGSQDSTVSFQEVSGLETETQIIEYRHSDSKQFSTIKMPGIAKTGNVTLKKGIFVNDNNFWKWYDAIKMNTIKRETVVIQLLDESAKPTMTWTLTNAWPTKITGTDLKSDANEVAVETLELAHEGLTIANGG
jgi:phage tail-like protein